MVAHPMLYGLDGSYLAVLDKADDIEVEEVLDEGDTLTLTLPGDDPKVELIVEDGEVVFEDRRYRITKIEKGRGDTPAVEVEAVGAWIELIDVTPTGVVEIVTRTPAIGLAEILVDSGWTAGTVEDAGVAVSTLVETNRTVLWLVRTWARVVGLEVEWDTLNRVVHLRTQIGTDRGTRFTYGRNLKNVRRESHPPVATVIWPTGRNGLTIASVNAGQRFLEDFSWYTDRGLTLAEARARFTKDYRFNDDRFLHADALMAYAERRLALLSQPVVSYEADVLDLQSVTGASEVFELGDTVRVRDDEVGVNVDARIVRYVRRPLKPEDNRVELAFLTPGLETPPEDQGISTELSLLGEQLVFGENEEELIFDASFSIGITLAISAYSATNAKIGLILVGTASAAGVLDIEVVHGDLMVRRFDWPVHSGANTISIHFVAGSLPQGSAELFFRLRTSTGTFTVAAFGGQLWLEAKNVAGGNAADDPDQYVFDTAPLNPYTVTDQADVDLQTPLAASVADIVPAPSVSDAGFYLHYLAPSVNADDGHTSDGPSFVTGANYVEVGDDAGEVFGAWYRFPVDIDLSAHSIAHAFLVGMGDQDDVDALTMVRAELAASPSAPTDRTDYLARSRTSASVAWDADVSSGVESTSPDLVAVVDELVAAYGASIDAILIFHEDRGSGTNAKMLHRSVENGTGPPMKLELWLTS